MRENRKAIFVRHAVTRTEMTSCLHSRLKAINLDALGVMLVHSYVTSRKYANTCFACRVTCLQVNALGSQFGC